MRRVGFHVECPLRFHRMMGGLAPSGANLCLCVGLLLCRMGLGRSLAECRSLQVGSRPYLVPGVDSLVSNPAPPRPSGPSHQWFGKILGGWSGAPSDVPCGLVGRIGIYWWGHRVVV